MSKEKFTATELLHAIEKDSQEDVRNILHSEPNLTDAMLPCGERALHFAVGLGLKEMVIVLLDVGANSRLQDSYLRTPLHVALRNGAEEIAKVFVESDSENDIQDIHAVTPLHYAADLGYVDVVKKLLTARVNPSVQINAGQTPLIEVRFRDKYLVDVPINWHIEKDIQRCSGMTPLHLAAKQGHIEIVKMILDVNVNTRLQDVCGMTPLHRALRNIAKDVAEVLVDWDGGNDLQDMYGGTPLSYAASRNYAETTRKLLASGSNPRVIANSSRTPLHGALLLHRKEAAEVIVSYDSENDIQDRFGKTPLHMAAVNGYVSIVRKLLLSNAHPHLKPQRGDYPLQPALRFKRYNIVKPILSSCAWRDIAINWEDLGLKDDEKQYCLKHLEECNAEIQSMKDTKLKGTNISFCDLAKASVDEMAVYIDNEDIKRVLFRDNALQEFPNYADLIAFKLERAKKTDGQQSVPGSGSQSCTE